MKSQIESRIVAVANYAGSQDLAAVLSRSMPERKTLGSEPSWMVARACMTPEEYIAFGRDGKPWRFMRGKPDIAQNCINVARGVVTDRCSAMRMECDWSRIDRYAATARRLNAAE